MRSRRAHEHHVVCRQVRRSHLAFLPWYRPHAIIPESVNRGMAAVEQNIRYKQELHAGDVISIYTEALEVKDKSIRFAHEMRNDDTDAVAATTILTAVHLDTIAEAARCRPMHRPGHAARKGGRTTDACLQATRRPDFRHPQPPAPGGGRRVARQRLHHSRRRHLRPGDPLGAGGNRAGHGCSRQQRPRRMGVVHTGDGSCFRSERHSSMSYMTSRNWTWTRAPPGFTR